MGGGHVPEPTRESLNEPTKTKDFSETWFYKAFDGPTEWFKTNVTDRFRRKYPYYHQRFPRVPTIDQCYIDDYLCYHEANEQYKRDRLVDLEIVSILRRRREQCFQWYGKQRDLVEKHCGQVMKDYDESSTNYFIKYGDMGSVYNVKNAFMKQKHRMLWEQKYGEVGSRGDPNKWPNYIDPTPGVDDHEDTLVGNLRKFGRGERPPKEMAP